MNYDDRMKDEVVQYALDVYDNNDVTMEEAMDIALEANATYNITLDRVPSSQKEYSDLSNSERLLLSRLIPRIEDWKSMPECKTRKKVEKRIIGEINSAYSRDLLMRSGYWNKIPDELKQKARIRRNRFKMKMDKDLRDAWTDSASKEGCGPRSCEGVSPEVLETALDMMDEFDISRDDAIDMALEYHGIGDTDYDIDDDSYSDYDDTPDYDYDDDDYYM